MPLVGISDVPEDDLSDVEGVVGGGDALAIARHDRLGFGVVVIPRPKVESISFMIDRGICCGGEGCERGEQYEDQPFHASTAAITLLSPTRTKPVRMGRDSSPSSVL